MLVMIIHGETRAKKTDNGTSHPSPAVTIGTMKALSRLDSRSG
jgi:hypothetical protein